MGSSRKLGLYEEAGRTVRSALTSWCETVRLGVLLLIGAVASAIFICLVMLVQHTLGI